MQKLIQSRLKEIFIVISAIIFKGKATHRFVRKRRKMLQQSSAESFHSTALTRALGKAALNPQHGACAHQGAIKVEMRSPDGHSSTEAAGEAQVREAHRIPG